MQLPSLSPSLAAGEKRVDSQSAFVPPLHLDDVPQPAPVHRCLTQAVLLLGLGRLPFKGPLQAPRTSSPSLALAFQSPSPSRAPSSPASREPHRRRRSSAADAASSLSVHTGWPTQHGHGSGATSGLASQGLAQPLPPIPGTPALMSPSRTPSPQTAGAWSGPGLVSSHTTASGRTSPTHHLPNGGSGGVTWASAKARSDEVNRYPAFSTRSNGFFARNYRSLSNSLPRFNSPGRRDYAEKEKLGRGRWSPAGGGRLGAVRTLLGGVLRRMRLRFLIVLGLLLTMLLFYATPMHRVYQRAGFLGGGSKFVVILAANQGGGVMEWKGPREWAIERDSVRNKKKYAKKWGYDLEIVDMSTKKRYAHEWRESWEKVDTIRHCLRKYPDAEWFWWLDLNTFIMEPSYSLQSHIFNDLKANTYRDINVYNPLNISHPLDSPHLDELARSVDGDGEPDSINLIVPQDCGGFNLGSFFMRRSAWTDWLLDIWWDPVSYEQKHMAWEHKEQDALEYLYTNQPWIRPHTAFISQRKINSFPQGACGDNGKDKKIHYDEKDRDFVVNMAGCEWGRDCWGEMYTYRELSNKLNRTLWEKLKDWISDTVQRIRHSDEDE
ncbi:MAG: alpha-1,6-mannosyltransferase [Thelocarpon impressellum]|nr:MAG: alpha-1,6-mannosyltransferase [Thelocarpon impressellum]